MQDYLSNVPAEIFEQILAHLNGIDLIRLKGTNKKFNKSLENPTALRLIFNEQCKRVTTKISYIDDNISWLEEMNRIYMHARSNASKTVTSSHTVHSSPEPIVSMRVLNNKLMLNTYALIDIQSCLQKKKLNFVKAWEEYLMRGQYAGRIEQTNQGCHDFYDVLDQSPIPWHKKLFQTSKSTLKSFNKTLAILKDEKNDELTAWNLNIICKHTDAVLWSRSTKKKEFCKECAFICTLEKKSVANFCEDSYCSQINQKLILLPKGRSLHVIHPIKGKNFSIEWSSDTQQIDIPRVNLSLSARLVYEKDDAQKNSTEERVVNIDGTAHHIVHCVVDKKHRFFDLTTKTLLVVMDCWPVYKWIPNTSNIAMAAHNEVMIIDFYQKKIISKFETYNYGWTADEMVLTMHATRSSQLLLIAQRELYSYYNTTNVVLYSAVTGARLVKVCRVKLEDFKMDLSDDEKTLIAWNDNQIYFYDLKEALVTKRREFKNKIDLSK